MNGYLSKLMWFSDETSYSFTDMTQSLGQLTASGGDIEKVIPMIMGMANATAYAGKGASEFSRVIYNLNQSYSQGYLSLMDWKSVELAGVATAELKKTDHRNRCSAWQDQRRRCDGWHVQLNAIEKMG